MHIPRDRERGRMILLLVPSREIPPLDFFVRYGFLNHTTLSRREGDRGGTRAKKERKKGGKKKEWNHHRYARPSSALPLVHRVHNFRNSGLSANRIPATSLYSGSLLLLDLLSILGCPRRVSRPRVVSDFQTSSSKLLHRLKWVTSKHFSKKIQISFFLLRFQDLFWSVLLLFLFSKKSSVGFDGLIEEMTPLRNAAGSCIIIHPAHYPSAVTIGPSPNPVSTTLLPRSYPLSHSTGWKFSGIIRDLRRGPPPRLPRPAREKDERLHLASTFFS